MKAKSNKSFTTLLRAAALPWVLAALASAPVLAADVYLVAKEYTKALPSIDATPPVNFNTVAGGIQSYGGAQDGTATVSVLDGGATLRIVGNGWKKISFPYAFTLDTILEFDFKSSVEGEIHGIGFDDNNLISQLQTYQLDGSQTYGIQDHNDYDGSGDWKHYVVAAGQDFTGNPGFLTFVMDHDVAIPTGESFFRNVKVHEPASLQVRMWGYAVDPDGFGTGVPEGPATSPGPAIVVPVGDDTLNVHLRNDLVDQDTSFMISGQEMPDAVGAAPVWNDGLTGGRTSLIQRVISFTPQALAGGGTMTYSWSPATGNPIKSGTYLYQSATHPSVQVQMGLYGAMTQDVAVGEAYTGVTYDAEQLLVYSEIDTTAHNAIAGAAIDDPGTIDDETIPTYGTPAYRSTIGYDADFFLINGEPYDPTVADSQVYSAFATGQRTLLRLVSASIKTHVPTLNGLYMSVVAEDGNALAYARELYSDRLAAGRTLDAVVIPSRSGRFAIYDHSMGLTNGSLSPGGMLAFFDVANTGTIDFTAVTLSSYEANQDQAPTVTIEDGGATLHLVGNTWKRIDLPWTVIPGVTTIEFDFKSTAEGEIHGIGLDDDNALGTGTHIFKLYGTQTYGNGTYNDYPTGADAQGWKHYSITLPPGYPIVNSIYLVFANDHDIGSPTAESYFRNVAVHD